MRFPKLLKFLNKILERETDAARDYEHADRIVRCFDGIDLTKQSFVTQAHGVSVFNKTPCGETKFYKAGEIDKAIEKINALVDELKRGRPLKKATPPEKSNA